ncbi:uncharacterized protein LOC118457361 [Anopheles albimanus]|uniref:uncharacterized protein LOC118457361 n=1 Tax=Anopheles albimanus TaxID=7167 RepID=UPI00164064A9|nr:uncharacterized protein LOC118457361 [Anopheles albimanus]XP_035774768.1 uncharacterized protein LOC118457361 [Anopheles albimanus]XP_035774769.1 uncharacterized protein LOC118457361 [Anopheles albimanus]XP_035774770.1 uncharacterized protein LOC118457361 [Anopheles albimanus]XP_035774771.1 uncharacterized protein LOC118457361 [Anopheles albimanus]
MMTFPKDINITIRTNDSQIERIKEYKFLGTIIDQGLKFHKHTLRGIQKAQKILNIIKMICNRNNHVCPAKAMQIHKAIIRGPLEFGATIIENGKKSILNKIDTIIHQSLRKVTGCTRTTPINTLMALAAEVPSRIRRKYLIAKETVKTIAFSTTNRQQLNGITRTRTNRRYSAQEQTVMEKDAMIKRIPNMSPNEYIRSDIEIRTEIPGLLGKKRDITPHVAKQIVCEHIRNTAKGKTKIYTDGSLTDAACGIGIVMQQPGVIREWAYKLSRRVAISTAELTAIDKALQLAITRNSHMPIIYTDSKASCEILKNALESDFVEETINNILSNCIYTNATIQWIPSHVGIPGNEKADMLAKRGTNCNRIIENQDSFKDIIRELKDLMMKEANRWYTEYSKEKGRTLYKLQEVITKKMWHCKTTLKAKEIRIINRLISGHDHSKYWLAKMKIVNSENCETCGVPETGRHRTFFCDRYRVERQKLNITLDKFEWSWKTREIKYLKIVTKFVTKYKINF